MLKMELFMKNYIFLVLTLGFMQVQGTQLSKFSKLTDQEKNPQLINKIQPAFPGLKNDHPKLPSQHPIKQKLNMNKLRPLHLSPAQTTAIQNYCSQSKYTYAQKVYYIIKIATGNITLAQTTYDALDKKEQSQANPLKYAYNVIQTAHQLLEKVDVTTATDAAMLKSLGLTFEQITSIQNYCDQDKYTYAQKVYHIIKVATGNTVLAQAKYNSIVNSSDNPIPQAYNVIQKVSAYSVKAPESQRMSRKTLGQKQTTDTMTDQQMLKSLGLTLEQIKNIENYCNQVAHFTGGPTGGDAAALDIGAGVLGFTVSKILESKAEKHVQLKYTYAQKVYYIIKIATGNLDLAQKTYNSLTNGDRPNANPLQEAFKVIKDASHVTQLSTILTNDNLTNLKSFINHHPTFNWTLNYNNLIWENIAETPLNAATWLGAANCVQYLLKNNIGNTQNSVNIVTSNMRSPLFRTMFPPKANNTLYPHQNPKNWKKIAGLLKQYNALNLY
jgi:hypothetical protein